MEIQENLKQLPIIESDIQKVRFGDTLSGILGSRYKAWEKGEIIFIHAPTGIGKTFFSLDDLYEWAITCASTPPTAQSASTLMKSLNRP